MASVLQKQWDEFVPEDFAVNVFQHEMDHLQGKRILDQVYKKGIKNDSF